MNQHGTLFSDQEGCEAFTYVNEWELNCFLKSHKGEESDFEGAVSGTLQPCSSALEQQIANGRGGVRGQGPPHTQERQQPGGWE